MVLRRKKSKKRKRKRACTYDSHPTWYGKTWHFLWHEDTWTSFFVDALLIVLIGKFILFPGFGLIMGTELPAVAVVSSSMEHNDQEFGEWWDAHENQYAAFNISEAEFENFRFQNGFSKGDVLVVKGEDDYDVGDIIIYNVNSRPYPIIHRVVGEDIVNYQTKGDANSGQISFEKSVSPKQIQGKAVLRIPYFGWLKVGLMELFN